MSQNDKKNTAAEVSDKWRELSNQAKTEETAEASADNEHLLPDESSHKTLIDKVNLLEKQADLYKDQVARTQADLLNTQRRMEQEVSKARKFGVEKLLQDLIPVVDSLIRALQGGLSNDPQAKAIREGVELTLDLLHKLLEKNGVVDIDPQAGDLFDPMQHEAMSMRADPDAASNTILQVLQKGYALHGRVIRAAMVIVAA